MTEMESRLEAIETRLSYLENYLEQISAAVIRQSDMYEKMQVQLERLQEEYAGEAVDIREIEPPPHY